MKHNEKAQTAILVFCVAVLSILVITGLYRCPIYGVLGIPCPGCGMTRAFLALARGEIIASFSFHPLAIPLLPFAVYAVIKAEVLKGKKLFSPEVLWVLIGIFIAVYIFRIILLFPHTAPMTYHENALLPKLFRMLNRNNI